MWRCHPAHLYMIDVHCTQGGLYHNSTYTHNACRCVHICFSLTQGGEGRAASRTTTLFKLLPSVECVSPRHLNAVQLQRKECTIIITTFYFCIFIANCVPMDEAEFCSHTYQRVYQYLRRHIAQISLDSFSYQPGSVEGSTADCLQILLRHGE